MPDAVVIGAGPAGLGVAASLRRAGVDPVVLERADAVGASWRGHYDRLHLHTTRRMSGLPGLPIPRRHGRWVPRHGVVSYLEQYTRHHDLQVRLGVEASRIDRVDGAWSVSTSDGPVRGRSVVVATGYNRVPFLPPWPGADAFEGTLHHSSAYRTAASYRGRDVLVVGAGNSGAEIAVDLVEGGAGRVRLSVRTPPQISPRAALGVPAQAVGILLRLIPPRAGDAVARALQRVFVGDLTRYGMPRSQEGLYSQFLRSDVLPILDVGLVGALQRRAIQVVAAVDHFESDAVVLADHARVTPDAVIAATGYRRGLESLVGHLGVLAANGRPLIHGERTATHAPGLHFIGFTNPLSGTLREVAIDAKRIARVVANGG